jgi:hypothetical protein
VRRLNDVIDHPALFNAYPHLARMPVEHNPFSFGMAGFNPDEKAFELNMPAIAATAKLQLGPGASAAESAKQNMTVPGALLHEIQHAIDAHEGYNFGANPRWFMPQGAEDTALNARAYAGNMYPDAHRAATELAQARGYVPKPEDLDKVFEALSRNKTPFPKDNDHSNLVQAIAEHPVIKPYIDAAKEYWKHYDVVKNAYDKYYGVSGEQLAETTRLRHKLTAQQRELRPPSADYTVPIGEQTVMGMSTR